MTESANILITGTGGGLGRCLHETLGGTGLTRENRRTILEDTSLKPDVIIHCAFNTARETPSSGIFNYLDDNILLTRQLLDLRHKMFIYISSIDVYPQDGMFHSEEEEIALNSAARTYSGLKLMNEALVREKSGHFLILRPSSLLGIYSRSNTLMRLVFEEKPRFMLSADSEYNIALHSDIARFLSDAIRRRTEGIFNFASGNNVRLSELAAEAGKSPEYGNISYRAGKLSNRKLADFDESYNRSSIDNFRTFLKGIRTCQDRNC